MCCFPVVKALMTLPSAESERLMFCASLSVCPAAAVFFTISLPARSTRRTKEMKISKQNEIKLSEQNK